MSKKITFDTVRTIGLALPNVEESTAYGVPALKVGGKLMACPAINKSAEPNTLAVFVDFDRRSLSVRQVARELGVSRGVIERALSRSDSSYR